MRGLHDAAYRTVSYRTIPYRTVHDAEMMARNPPEARHLVLRIYDITDSSKRQ